MKIPTHLQPYVFDQGRVHYSSEDHAVWRYIMRQLTHFLFQHGHPSYKDGLNKAGITIESIPSIKDIDKKLKKFGWRAIPVSGFIPPSAFMEFQALSILPIASEMRTIDHILYTPAPDIVHEAAGHAPLLTDPEYSQYLKEYSQISKKAITSKQDIDLYRAIRNLSDIKEKPSSTAKDIAESTKQLQKAQDNLSYVSEAALLGRMNWWTAEYGLIGDKENCKISGAGLLSSIQESELAVTSKVKKINLDIDCISYSYDITNLQPQLFVAPHFKRLTEVLHKLEDRLSFKRGGEYGLTQALRSENINTVELDSGLQISGLLDQYLTDNDNNPIFIKFSSPTQLSWQQKQIEGHGTDYHTHGYSTPLGTIKNQTLHNKSLSDLRNLGIEKNKKTTLYYDSGFTIAGLVTDILEIEQQPLLVTFKDCTVTYKEEKLFEPSWGNFDLALGSKVVSVFGGASDALAYGQLETFSAPQISPKTYSDHQLTQHTFYSKVRELREAENTKGLSDLFLDYEKNCPHVWLLGLEFLELALKSKQDSRMIDTIKEHCEMVDRDHGCLKRGLAIAHH